MSRLIIDIDDDPPGRDVAHAIRRRLVWERGEPGLRHYFKIALMAWKTRVRVIELDETPSAYGNPGVCCLCMVTEDGEPFPGYTTINGQAVCRNVKHIEAAEMCGGSFAKAAAFARSAAGLPS